VDQALLLLRTGLPRIDNLGYRTTYAQLRAIGVRSSTDLLELVARLQLDLTPGGPWPPSDSPAHRLDLMPDLPPPNPKQRKGGPPSLTWLATVPLLTRMAVAATTLRHEPNLRLIMNWHRSAPEGAVDGADVHPRRKNN
jgi:hypothetical protein